MSDKSKQQKTVVIEVEMTPATAEAFAEFLKRSTYIDYRERAVDQAETEQMLSAVGKLREAFARAGFDPR